MRRWTPPLRIPKTPHKPGHRMVPVTGCGCITCKTAREDNDPDAQHWARVGNLLGLATCPCGALLDVDGRCSEYINCAFSVEGARR